MFTRSVPPGPAARAGSPAVAVPNRFYFRARREAGLMASPRLMVHPPDEREWRRVRYDGRPLDTAYLVFDIAVLLVAAG